METVQIDKLNGLNFSSWSEDITAVLIDRNLWRIVSGEEKPPTGEKVAEVKEFELRSGKAFSTLYLNIEKEYRCLLSGIRDGHTAWKTLHAHFRPDSRARAVSLTDEYFSSRITGDDDIGRYAARLKNIINQLRDVGKPVPEWYQPFQLIRFLPPDYTGIIQSIYRWSDEEFTFDKVLQELLAEEARIKLSNTDHLAVALASNTKNPANTNEKGNCKTPCKKKNIRDRKCFRCGKFGHLMADCKVKCKKKTSQENPESHYMLEACHNQETPNCEAWVFDTAASSHFCCNKELLLDFKPVSNKDLVVAIDGVTCKIEGVGKVRMSFRIKGKEEIVNLHNVLYSPKLRRNLMAGPLFDKGGATFVGGRGKIDIFNAEDRKICTAKKENGLYFLYPKYPSRNKSSVNNLEEKQKCLTASESKESKLGLWHSRYCHINPQYILTTSKNNAVKGIPVLTKTDLKCEPCALAKTRRTSFKPIGKIRSSRPLELLHMDLCGPLPCQSLGGHNYF